MPDERDDPAVEVERLVGVVPLVLDEQVQPLVEVCRLPEPLGQDRTVPLDDWEHLRIRGERGDRAGRLRARPPFDLRGLVRRLRDLPDLRDGLATRVLLLVDLAVPMDL